MLQGAVDARHLYVHAQALSLYGPSPLPQAGHADLCVASGDFVIAAARYCRPGQRPARFTEIKPADTAEGPQSVPAYEQQPPKKVGDKPSKPAYEQVVAGPPPAPTDAGPGYTGGGQGG